MRATKLLTISILWSMFLHTSVFAQCSLIKSNGSFQDPNSVCSPVEFKMNVWYKFIVPLSPADISRVEIEFVWNDVANTTTLVSGNWNANLDSVWAEAIHIYPPDDECSKTAQAYLVFDGVRCTSSGYQEQTFSTWGTDEENSGELAVDPPVEYVCEGNPVNVSFADNSTFNCNLSIEPDNPNDYFRWVQFIYNTYDQGGDRIPEVSVTDEFGIVHQLTDASGGGLGQLAGPIVQIPIPANGPNQISYTITAPPNGVVGDIFEITMRNWNVCNPYDELPMDANPPGDPIDGDNPPIEITARVEIIAPPPVVTTTLNEYCTGETIILSANASGAGIRWYQDSLLTSLLYEGETFNPMQPPYNLDNTVAGNHSFWVSSNQGMCESGGTRVNVLIHQSPLSITAGADQFICADNSVLAANNPTVGSGAWTTSSGAVIGNPAAYNSSVTNLDPGENTFTWEISNGPCTLTDDVVITRDVSPSPAFAGNDSSYCHTDSLILKANTPDNGGSGQWNVLLGSGLVSDAPNPAASFKNPSSGNNILLWRISSKYGICPVTSDSLVLQVDLHPGDAFAGTDTRVCEDNSAGIVTNLPVNNGVGYWSVASGSSFVSDSLDYATLVNNLNYGSNSLVWNVHSFLGICPSDADTLEIFRDESPGVANAGTDTAFCLETSYQLNANAPYLGTAEWRVIQNPTATAPSFSPDKKDSTATFSVVLGDEGLYKLEWYLENNSCESRDTVTIDFGTPPPAANAGADTSVCDTSVVLHANAFTQGNTYWNQVSGAHPLVFDPNATMANSIVRISEGQEGAYQLEWNIESGSCPKTNDTVTITFKAAPTQPLTSDVENCGQAVVTLEASSTSSDDILLWHTNATDSIPVDTGSLYTTPNLLADAVYYIRSKDTISGCISEATSVNAFIHEVPATPLLIPDTLCGEGQGSLVGYFAPPANTIRWYADKADSMSVSTSSNYLTSHLSSSSRFYADAFNAVTGCSSKKDSVDVFVWPEVPVPVVLSDSSCYPKSFRLVAYKSDPSNLLFWYDSASGGSVISVSDTLTTITIDTTKSFWVSEFNAVSFCKSERVEVKAIIHNRPMTPIINDTTHCGPADFVLVPEIDVLTDNVFWYNSLIDPTPFAVEDTLYTSTLTANKTYWLKAVNTTTGCESDLTDVKMTVFALPTPINISGPSVVLKDQAGIVFATNGASSSTYQWEIPTEIPVDANMNDFIRLSFPNTGSYTISVTETSTNGCPGIKVNHPIEVIDDSVLVEIGTENLSSCTNAPFEISPYLFGGMPPYTYQWTGDTTYLLNTDRLYTSFYAPTTGTYILYLRVKDIYNKEAFDTVTITVFDAPETSIVTQDSIVCVGDNLELQTNSIGALPAVHRWIGPVAYLNDYNIAAPEYTPIAADTVSYVYQFIDAHGCSAYDTIELQSDIPHAGFDLDTIPGCSPLPVGFINTSRNAASFVWNFDDGTSSEEINPEHVFTNSLAEVAYYNVKLEAISRLGCSDIKSTYVSVWPNPVAELNAMPNESCSPANVVLYSSPGNTLYKYDFGNGESYAGNKLSHVQHYVNNSEEDQVFKASVITQTAFGCVDSASTEILVHATPQAMFDLTPPYDTFPNNTFALVNRTEGNYNYSWEFGNGTISTLKDPGIVTYEGAGNYTIQLKASNQYCADSTTKTAYLYPATPKAEFVCSGPGCMPHTVTLVNNSEYADSYYWEFGDGSVSTAKNPSYTYYQSGKYRISLTVKGEGGESYFSDTLSVYIIPNSFFDIAPRKVYVNDEAVHYFNLSEHGDSYEWDFGDGTISTEMNPTHVYKEEGTFNVTLKVWTSKSCFDLYVMDNAVMVEPSGNIRYPNVIRPNSPFAENRVFLPGVIDNVDSYHLMIFNRWGEKIFDSKNVDKGWDGTYKGSLVKQDVYVWKVEGTYTDGKAFEKKGDVTLLY